MDQVTVSSGKFEGCDLRSVPVEELELQFRFVGYEDKLILREELHERWRRSKNTRRADIPAR